MKTETAVTHDVQLVQSWAAQLLLTSIRDTMTPSGETYRMLVSAIGVLLCEKAMMSLPLKNVSVMTPTGKLAQGVVPDAEIRFVPIERSGWGFELPALALAPSARSDRMDLDRDHETLLPRLRKTFSGNYLLGTEQIFVLDPMLATGGSAAFAVDLVKE